MRLLGITCTVGVLGAMLATGAAAQASLASLTGGGLVVDGLPGEANRILLTRAGNGGAVRVADAGAPIAAGEDCRRDGDAIVCGEGRWIAVVHVRLRDGDDRFELAPTAPGLEVDVDGGEGADLLRGNGVGVLRGGEGDDDLAGAARLEGGSGDDRLRDARWLDGQEGDDELIADAQGGEQLLIGGPGRDHLRGGPGDDVFADDDGVLAAADVYDGGGGTDAVSYLDAREPLLVDLDAEIVARSGIADALRGIERVTGGRAGDAIRGSARADRLEGGPGADRILAGAGADSVTGGAGDDMLLGGRGDDQLGGDDEGGDDHLAGGPGTDMVRGGRGRDVVRVSAFDLVLPGPGDDLVRVLGRGATVEVHRDRGSDRVSCRARPFTLLADRRDRLTGRCASAAARR